MRGARGGVCAPTPPGELPQNAAPAIGNLPRSRDGALGAGRGAITGARALGPGKTPPVPRHRARQSGENGPRYNRMGPGDKRPSCGDAVGPWVTEEGRNGEGGPRKVTQFGDMAPVVTAGPRHLGDSGAAAVSPPGQGATWLPCPHHPHSPPGVTASPQPQGDTRDTV